MNIDHVVARSGWPKTAVAEISKARDRKIPASLIVGKVGKMLDYAPTVLGYLAVVDALRSIFGMQSPLTYPLAMAALPTIERIWHEGAAPGEAIKITACGVHLAIPADVVTRAKASR